MADQWYYMRGDQQVGPVTREQLQQAAGQGEVVSSTMVWAEGIPQWTPAGNVPGLMDGGSPPASTQPAAYGQAQPSAAMPVSYQTPGYSAAQPPSHLAAAILTTLFCCQPFGIVSIVFAAQVGSKWSAGDYQGAMESSKKASMWAWLGFGIGGAVIAIYLIVVFAFMGSASRHVYP